VKTVVKSLAKLLYRLDMSNLFSRPLFFLSFYCLADTIEAYLMRNSDGSYSCNGCGYSSTNKTDVSRHVESHHMALQYPCKVCDQVLKTRRCLTNHMRSRHYKARQ
jgi:hypothetical protein